MRLATAVALTLLFALAVPATADSVPIDNGVPVVAPDGPAVNVTESTNITLDNTSATFPDPNTVHINTTTGDATFSSSGYTHATTAASELTGPWTNATELLVTNTQLTIDPADKPFATVEGDVTEVALRDGMTIDDGQVDFVYGGPSGMSEVSVGGLTPGVSVVAVDQSGTELASGIVGPNGRVTFSALPTSRHVVRIQTGDGMETTPTGEVEQRPGTGIGQQTLVVLLVFTSLTSWLVLTRRVQSFVAFAAFVLWELVAYGATRIRVDDCAFCDPTYYSNDALAILSAVFGVVMLLFGLGMLFGFIDPDSVRKFRDKELLSTDGQQE